MASSSAQTSQKAGRAIPLPPQSKNFESLEKCYENVIANSREADNPTNVLLGTLIAVIKEQKIRSDNDRAEITKIKWKLSRAENNVKMQSISAAAEKLKSTVLVHGLSYHQKADSTKRNPETNELTRQRLEGMFKDLELPIAQVPIDDCFRFTARNPEEGQKKRKTRDSETVQVVFQHPRAKAAFYRALAKKKNKELNVQDCIPKQLMKRRAELEKAAYDIRQKDKSTKTRINYKNGDLELKARKKDEKNFTVVEVSKTEKRKSPETSPEIVKEKKKVGRPKKPKNDSTTTNERRTSARRKNSLTGKRLNMEETMDTEEPQKEVSAGEEDKSENESENEILREGGFQVEDDNYYEEHTNFHRLTAEDLQGFGAGGDDEYDYDDRDD